MIKAGSFYSYLLFVFTLCFVRHYGANNNFTDTVSINKLLSRSLILQRTNQDSAFLLATEAYKSSNDLNYKKGIAGSLIRIGSVLFNKGKYDTSIIVINKALSIRKYLNDYKGASGACVLLSYIYQAKGKTDAAFSVLYEALRMNQEIKDSINLVQTYISLGNLSNDYGNDKRALKNYQEALKIAHLINYNEGVELAYDGLGNYYFKAHDFHRALFFFLKNDSISRFSGDVISNAQNLMNLALCYENTNNYNEAHHFYSKAILACEKQELKKELANCYYNLASLQLKIKQPDSNIVSLKNALTIAKRIRDLEMMSLSTEALANSYAILGDYFRAYQFHVDYLVLSDSLLNKEKIKQIAEMQTKYESDKKDKEIELLAVQNNTKIAQRNMLITISVLLLVVLVATSLFYLQRNRIAKKNEQLAQEKISSLLKEQEIKSYNAMIEGQEIERKRIATDLHDRIGSILSTVKLLFSSLDEKIDTVQEENMIQFSKANKLLDEAVLEVRRISYNLSTGMVNTFGLKAALEELCSSIHNSKLIRCKLLYFGLNARLTPQVEIGVYRMVQEMVTNILKHAKAKNITVQVNRSEEAISITVEDDGVGFVVGKKSTGLGLKNLKSRAMKLNGTYNVDSQPGRGTISIIEIPLNDNHDTNSDS